VPKHPLSSTAHNVDPVHATQAYRGGVKQQPRSVLNWALVQVSGQFHASVAFPPSLHPHAGKESHGFRLNVLEKEKSFSLPGIEPRIIHILASSVHRPSCFEPYRVAHMKLKIIYFRFADTVKFRLEFCSDCRISP